MSSSLDLLDATIAGKYRLRRRIGIGGMGTVYEAQHVELGKRVAIKIIDAAGAMSAELALRFKREARAASAVESEHIVQVFDVGFDPDAGLFMVMEFLDGEDLEHRLRREGKLDVNTAAILGHQTARALARAHASGVVHRDLKPANVFLTLTEEGALRVKVLDFGISKITSDVAVASRGPEALALTQEGIALGTPQYMSPEQARGLATVDGRTDIWSLGAVLYEAVSGRPAYPPLSPEQVMYKVLREDAAPLATIAPWVPAEMARLIHDALSRDLGRRVPDCHAFASRLAAAVPTAGLGARASASWPTAAAAAMAESLDEGQTQVLDRDHERDLEDDEEGPDTFRDGLDAAIPSMPAGSEMVPTKPEAAPFVADASAWPQAAPEPHTQRDFPPPPPRALQADVVLRAASEPPVPVPAPMPGYDPHTHAHAHAQWNERNARSRPPPSTLGNAIRSMSLPPLPPREVFAATITACVVIVFGGALIWGSRVMLGDAAPSDAPAAAAVSPPPATDDLAAIAAPQSAEPVANGRDAASKTDAGAGEAKRSHR